MKIEVESEDKTALSGPVRIGIGSEDTTIVFQPNLLTVGLIKTLTDMIDELHVRGCGNFKLRTDNTIRQFCKLKLEVKDVRRVENRGAQTKNL